MASDLAARQAAAGPGHALTPGRGELQLENFMPGREQSVALALCHARPSQRDSVANHAGDGCCESESAAAASHWQACLNWWHQALSSSSRSKSQQGQVSIIGRQKGFWSLVSNLPRAAKRKMFSMGIGSLRNDVLIRHRWDSNPRGETPMD